MAASKHIVAIVGGAVAGAEMAGLLAPRGVQTVVFEQNARPYGKIEDGLPRWHVKLRHKEYDTINRSLDHPNVHFVPQTRIGRDVDFAALVRDWGFSMVVFAHGAWRDRPLPIAGADAFVGRGLEYQNPFIYWFNHYEETGYDGPAYEVSDGTIVVGGGLASIDVAKALQIEVVRGALRRRGIPSTVVDVELDGVGATLERHGLRWDELGLRPATIFYRRRIEDMPLLDMPDDADAVRRAKVEATRRKLVEKAMGKYLFAVRPLVRPVDLLARDDRLVGLRFQQTRSLDGRIVDEPGATEDVHAAATISSIGSIAEPLRGVPMCGELYDFSDPELGRLRGFDNVFAIGNVVTGRGNILVSRRHSAETTELLIEKFLGLGKDGSHDGEQDLMPDASEGAGGQGERVAAWLGAQPAVAPERIAAILERVRRRQAEVGYDGRYRDWIARVSPPDMA